MELMMWKVVGGWKWNTNFMWYTYTNPRYENYSTMHAGYEVPFLPTILQDLVYYILFRAILWGSGRSTGKPAVYGIEFGKKTSILLVNEETLDISGREHKVILKYYLRCKNKANKISYKGIAKY